MSKIPNGVPTVTYCRLVPSAVSMGQGDVVGDGNAVVVLEPGQPSSRFEVAQVLEKSLSDEEVCELTFGSRAGAGMGAVLNPITAFVNDAANVVVLLTGSRMTKKWQFMKRCLLPFIANEILATIADRSQAVASNMYKAQLTLSAFEIQDEIIGDLLRPANRGLPIVTSLEEGTIVQGLHKETIVDEVTLRRLLVEACDNRGVQGLPVGGNIDTSCGIMEFRLYQSEPSNGGVFQTQDCYSRMVVVDVASTDPLNASSGEEIRLLAGPTLHKSLLTFFDVTKKLNNPYRAQLAPFRASKLTHFLSEMLGGNAVVVALAQVCAGEPQVSRRTLDLMSALNTAVHYPMGARELSDTLRGLLGKYRAMLMHVNDELSTNSHQAHDKDDEQSGLITRLQKELAVSVSEMNTAQEDRARIFEVSELLKAKYNTLMEEKLKQSDELAQSEEDNIALAKEIVENELAHTQASEKMEKEKLDLRSELLQAQARIAGLESDLSDALQTVDKLEVQVKKGNEEIQQRDADIREVHRLLDEKSTQLNEQKEKNIELGAELLTLVNHKDMLQVEVDELRTKNDSIVQDLSGTASKQAADDAEIRRLLEKILLKDEEILDLRKKAGLDSVLGKSPSEEVSASVVRAVDNMRSAVDGKKEKHLIRQTQQLEKALQRMQADLEGETREKAQLQEEVHKLREKYRQLLEASYQQGSTQRPVPAPEESTGLDLLDEAGIDSNLQSLLSSYHQREQALEAAVVSAQDGQAEAIAAYRGLFDNYRALLDTVEDMLSILSDNKFKGDKKGALEARAQKLIEAGLTEQYKFSRALLGNAESQLNEMEDPRSKYQRKDIMAERDQSDVETNERLAAVMATFRRNLQAAETKLAQSMQENVDLRIQIKQLLNPSRQQAEARKESAEDTKGTGVAYAAALEAQTNQLSEQYRIMYQNFTGEILDLKKQLLASRAREREKEKAEKIPSRVSTSRSAVGTPVAALSTLTGDIPTASLPQRAPSAPSSVEAAVVPIATSRSTKALELPIGPEASPGAGTGMGRKSFANLFSATDFVPSAQSMAPAVAPPPQVVYVDRIVEVERKAVKEDASALKQQLMASEQRAAQMASRQIGLEEELKAYQAYMKEVLPQYQRMLQKENKPRVDGASSSKPSAASMAAAKEILKLPSLNR